jgi:phosphoribosylformylglycinamidine (FGAM) synthase-like amidotransferase family enzyme
MKHMRNSFIIIALLLAGTAWGQEKAAKTRVAIYKDAGTTTKGPVNIEKSLQNQPDFSYAYVKADDIRGGVLAKYDVVVLPGGTASTASKTLGEEGRKVIVEYVKGGGGYLGVCAGAYLATCRKAGDLALINAYSAGGGFGDGMTKIRLTEEGQKFFATKDELVDVYYANGPLLEFADDKDLPKFTALALFETDLPKKTPPGLVKGKVAAACAPYGKGRVFCFSPHPERPESTGLQYYIRCALLWAAGKDPTTASKATNPSPPAGTDQKATSGQEAGTR